LARAHRSAVVQGAEGIVVRSTAVPSSSGLNLAICLRCGHKEEISHPKFPSRTSEASAERRENGEARSRCVTRCNERPLLHAEKLTLDQQLSVRLDHSRFRIVEVDRL
jgi:hypothetical protein